MSKHWNPDKDLRDKSRKPLPPGAGAALLILGVACIATAAGLYELIGPRDVFARDSASDWSALDEAAGR